jgi:hypothetical protein
MGSKDASGPQVDRPAIQDGRRFLAQNHSGLPHGPARNLVTPGNNKLRIFRLSSKQSVGNRTGCARDYHHQQWRIDRRERH